MSKLLKLLFSSGICALMASCMLFPIIGSGNIVSEERSLPTIGQISIEGQADIEASYGTSQSLIITTDDNIIGEVETFVDQGRLVVRNRNFQYFDPTNGIKIKLVMIMHPDNVNISGAGSFKWVDVNPIQVYRLSLEISGSGDLNLAHSGASIDLGISGSGKAIVSSTNSSSVVNISGSGSTTLAGSSDNASVTISGSGYYNAYNYVTLNTQIIISGSGSAYVYASGLLNCIISGSGSVFYKGSPSVSFSGSGSGTVNPS